MSRAAQPPPPEPARHPPSLTLPLKGGGDRLERLAIVVSRGSSNNLFQVATLIRAATALEVEVDAFFHGTALQKLERGRVNRPEWSAAYAAVESSLAERLRAADFTDMETFLRDAKEHGDAVRYWASSETLVREGLTLDELISEIDGVRTEERFLADACAADALLTF